MGLCLSFGFQTFLEVYITSKLISCFGMVLVPSLTADAAAAVVVAVPAPLANAALAAFTAAYTSVSSLALSAACLSKRALARSS
jgi:hypothetical protein